MKIFNGSLPVEKDHRCQLVKKVCNSTSERAAAYLETDSEQHKETEILLISYIINPGINYLTGLTIRCTMTLMLIAKKVVSLQKKLLLHQDYTL